MIARRLIWCDAVLVSHSHLSERQAARDGPRAAVSVAVFVRKRTGGTRTDHGDRFIERALTGRETCRPQGRDLHDSLLAAITAALHGQPPPSLLPSGP
jgi:hypothetical protein